MRNFVIQYLPSRNVYRGGRLWTIIIIMYIKVATSDTAIFEIVHYIRKITKQSLIFLLFAFDLAARLTFFLRFAFDMDLVILVLALGLAARSTVIWGFDDCGRWLNIVGTASSFSNRRRRRYDGSCPIRRRYISSLSLKQLSSKCAEQTTLSTYFVHPFCPHL